MIAISQPLLKCYQVKADTSNLVNHTGDTNETTLKSYPLPGGTLGKNGAIRLWAFGASFGEGGSKTYKLKLGDEVVKEFTVTAGVANKQWLLIAKCYNQNSNSSQNWSFIWINNDNIEEFWARTPTTKDTTVEQVLSITGQLADSGDYVRCGDFTVEVNPMP